MSRRRGATFVHAVRGPVVIAGQGTIGLELVEQLPEVETRRDPGRRRRARVGHRPRAARGQAATSRSSASRRQRARPSRATTELGYTIAEGIAVKQPGELTSTILGDHLDDIVTVTDEEISEAIVLLLERTKLVVEGAGAASVAALLARHGRGGGPAVALLSGGNIDPTLLIQVDAPRADARGPLSRRPHAHPRPARRADQAPFDVRGRARERRLDRAPPRGHGRARRGDGGRG